MKPLTTSVYTFPRLIDGGFLYVDKTASILELVRPATAQYFLSRPRRFGKSLLVSTIKAIFQGRRELFSGLAIDRAEYDWKIWPVIHLDLGDRYAPTPQALETSLAECIKENADAAGIKLETSSAASRFRELVVKLADRSGRVVILVDEYDKPLLGHLGQPGAGQIQQALKAFYSVIKTTEPFQRFVLVTGVSKFSRVSIFSDLNNLTDLTMDRRTATLLGYTQTELESCFPDYIDSLATATSSSREATLENLRLWYNGYRFHYDAQTVYNPVSVMRCFDTREFNNYWFETGTPSFLVELLRSKPLSLDCLEASDSAFSAYEPDNLEPLPLLFQTGYLTLKSMQMQGILRIFRLGFPNLEVETSFSSSLVRAFSGVEDGEMMGALSRMVAALKQGDVDRMMTDLGIFFAKVPNTITLKQEKYWQTIFFTVFTLIGAMTEAEVSTNIGRVDCVVKTEHRIYVFEFKLDGSAESALEQIRRMRYAQRYKDDGRQVLCVGVAFGQKERNLGAWLVEPA